MWETGAPRLVPLALAQPQVTSLWGRTAALVALAGTLAATALISAPKAEQAGEASLVEVAETAPKTAMRVAAWQPPRREPETAPAAAPAPSAPATLDDLFTPAFAAAPSRFEPSRPTAAETSAFQPWTPPPAPPAAWIDGDFTNVAALDGRTLQAGDLRIRLAGLDLPMPEQMCRTLDGRFEPCTSRATTQLDLLTRHRTIACRYRLERAGEAVGECRIGASDLVERLVQTGYVWRTAALATGATR